jgi:glycosyltransferase involved in cell wall biosynthesis
MLSDTLQSWLDVDLGTITAQLVVVDNASTDETLRVCEAYKKSYQGDMDYVHEPEPGLSIARNTGIAFAKGRIIAFVDDDIYFHPNWLVELCSAFELRPDVQCVGGKSIPTFEVPRPSWLSDGMMMFYGSTQSGDVARPMVFPEHPFGVNMAFRREVFDQIGGFRTDLGRIKNSLLSNEEKELFFRVKEAGMNVFYEPKAELDHRVPADRVSEQWLVRRAYWQGISNVVFDRHIRRYSWLGTFRNFLRSGKALLLGSGTRSLRQLYEFHRRSDLGTRLYRYNLLGVTRQSACELIRPARNA